MYYEAKYDTHHVTTLINDLVTLCLISSGYTFLRLEEVLLKKMKNTLRMGGKMDPMDWPLERVSKGRYKLCSLGGKELKSFYSSCLLKEYFEASERKVRELNILFKLFHLYMSCVAVYDSLIKYVANRVCRSYA